MLRRLVLVALVSVAAPLAAAEPVALVTELSGTASVGLKAQAAPLELLQDLAPGARVSLANGARATVVHTASGVVYELAGPGVYRVQAKAVEGADATSRVTRRELPAELRAYKLNPMVAAQASIVLRSGSGVELDGPNGGVLSEDELRYRVTGDVRQVRFEVLDESGATVARFDDAGNAIDLKGRHAWAAARLYRLQATGLDRAGRTVTLAARFTVMAPDVVERVRRSQPASVTATTDWIVYALALESLGANASARSIWRALHAAR